MEPEEKWESEKLPSGVVVVRRRKPNGDLIYEQFTVGLMEIGLQRSFEGAGKPCETYFSRKHMVSRRTYEARRTAYPDMPPASAESEDFGADLLRMVRAEQKRNSKQAAERLAQSAESEFPRPAGTNWLRVISGDRAHLLEFASKDWKFISRERDIRAGSGWLERFGFRGLPGDGFGISQGLQIGYEIQAKREALLNITERLLEDVKSFSEKPPERVVNVFAFAPQKRRYKPNLARHWVKVLPPLVEFLSGLQESTVAVFNHHQ